MPQLARRVLCSASNSRLQLSGSGPPNAASACGVLMASQRVFLIGADHPGGSALDPAGRVMADLVAGIVGVQHAAALVEDQPRLLVEGNALDRHAGIAD
jgi:hypothetical protein